MIKVTVWNEYQHENKYTHTADPVAEAAPVEDAFIEPLHIGNLSVYFRFCFLLSHNIPIKASP